MCPFKFKYLVQSQSYEEMIELSQSKGTIAVTLLYKEVANTNW